MLALWEYFWVEGDWTPVVTTLTGEGHQFMGELQQMGPMPVMTSSMGAE